jgi:uncharacterized RDD family membrane protein YckC
VKETYSNTVRIVTPTGVDFSFRLADPVTRSIALFIDVSIISVSLSTIKMTLVLLELLSPDFRAAIEILIYFLVSMGYTIMMEWFYRGQTLGKRVMKLQVIDEGGLRLHFSQIFMRNLLRFIDMMPMLYVIGGLASVINKKSQRLGDFAANTIVINLKSTSIPDVTQLDGHKYNSFRESILLVNRIHRKVSNNEAALALRSVLRRESLDSGERLKIYKEQADYFKEKLDLPEELTQNMSDEQLIRNIVDIMWCS